MPAARTLSADDWRALLAPALTPPDCASRRLRLICPGWELVSQPLGPPQLRPVGTLRAPGDDEPAFSVSKIIHSL